MLRMRLDCLQRLAVSSLKESSQNEGAGRVQGAWLRHAFWVCPQTAVYLPSTSGALTDSGCVAPVTESARRCADTAQGYYSLTYPTGQAFDIPQQCR